jgi:hypothetical protein
LPGWADEAVDFAVRWNRVNRHFNIIYLASGNLWNRHWLEGCFNQSSFRIRPSHCGKMNNECMLALAALSVHGHRQCFQSGPRGGWGTLLNIKLRLSFPRSIVEERSDAYHFTQGIYTKHKIKRIFKDIVVMGNLRSSRIV